MVQSGRHQAHLGHSNAAQGTPKWGAQWKAAVKENYLNFASFDVHGGNMVYRDVYVDLDPIYKDAWNLPLLRFTFEWKDNDIRMSLYVTDQMLKVARAMGPKSINVSLKNFGDHFDLRPYQTTHWAGGMRWARTRRRAY